MGGSGIKEEEPVRETPSVEHLVYGAILECDMGDCVSFLTVDGQNNAKNASIRGIPKAVVTDSIPRYNVGSFGQCKSGGNCQDLIGNYKYGLFSGIKTASTSLDPEWTNPVAEKLRLHKKQILTMDSYITCKYGGTILPLTTGQDGELYYWHINNVLIPVTNVSIMQFDIWCMLTYDMPAIVDGQIYGYSPYISGEDWMTGSERSQLGQMGSISDVDSYMGGLSSISGGSCEIDWPSSPHTNGTVGHWETIQHKVAELSESGDYSKIYVNQGLHNEVPDTAVNRRPDIMAVRPDGIIDQFEVPSKTDTVAGLTNRMIDNQRMLGDRAGSIEVVPIKP